MRYSILLLIVFLNGCATITRGTTDTLQVEIANCGEPIECAARNKKGRWNFRAPGPVTFKKSDGNLTLRCKDGDETLTRVITPTRGASAWGNLIAGGAIGAGIDAGTDAHWNIADRVTLHRRYCRGKLAE